MSKLIKVECLSGFAINVSSVSAPYDNTSKSSVSANAVLFPSDPDLVRELIDGLLRQLPKEQKDSKEVVMSVLVPGRKNVNATNPNNSKIARMR